MEIFLSLPEETWVIIISKLDLMSWSSLSSCNMFFHRLCNENMLWNKFFRKRFGENVKTRPFLTDELDWKQEYKWRLNPNLRIQFFNENPKECLKRMFAENILRNGMDIVRFLRDTKGLDHKNLYEVIRHPEEYGLPSKIYQDTIKELDISGLNVVEALRLFLFHFGNLFFQGGQEMAIFALSDNYWESNAPDKHLFNSAKELFGFFYSIIMLNTDAHNPQVKHKMQCKQFIQNIKQIGITLNEDYLSMVYQDILHNPIQFSHDIIKIPSEQCIYSGWLNIRTLKGSKKRWVILQEDCILYYKTKKSKPDENYTGIIEIFYNTVIHRVVASKQFKLENPTESFTFIVNDTDKLNEWTFQINNVITTLVEESKIATELLLST